MKHGPPVVNVATGIAPVFVEHIQVVGIKMLLKVFTISKLTVGEYLIGLPVGTTLPPTVIVTASPAPAPTTVVVVRGIAAQIGRDEILERMTHFMSYGMPTTSHSSPRVKVAYSRIAPRAIGFLSVSTRSICPPLLLIGDVKLYLVFVGSRTAFLDES